MAGYEFTTDNVPERVNEIVELVSADTVLWTPGGGEQIRIPPTDSFPGHLDWSSNKLPEDIEAGQKHGYMGIDKSGVFAFLGVQPDKLDPELLEVFNISVREDFTRKYVGSFMLNTLPDVVRADYGDRFKGLYGYTKENNKGVEALARHAGWKALEGITEVRTGFGHNGEPDTMWFKPLAPAARRPVLH